MRSSNRCVVGGDSLVEILGLKGLWSLRGRHGKACEESWLDPKLVRSGCLGRKTLRRPLLGSLGIEKERSVSGDPQRDGPRGLRDSGQSHSDVSNVDAGG